MRAARAPTEPRARNGMHGTAVGDWVLCFVAAAAVVQQQGLRVRQAGVEPQNHVIWESGRYSRW